MNVPLHHVVRRYLDEGILGRDRGALAEVLVPGYRFETGGHVIHGRDQYIEMVTDYLRREPTIGVTVHEVFTDGAHVAVQMTKHTSAPQAAWAAVLLYSGTSGRLSRCWSEQDWETFVRHRRAGTPTPVAPAAVGDPWATVPLPPDSDTAEVAAAWVRAGDLHPGLVAFDDPSGPSADQPVLDVETVTVNCWFAAGCRFAFHLTQHGTYRGGMDGCEAHAGQPGDLHIAGTGTVIAGRVGDVRAVSDRIGLKRRLAAALNV